MLLNMQFKVIVITSILFRHALVPALSAIDLEVTEIKPRDDHEVWAGEGKSVDVKT